MVDSWYYWWKHSGNSQCRKESSLLSLHLSLNLTSYSGEGLGAISIGGTPGALKPRDRGGGGSGSEASKAELKEHRPRASLAHGKLGKGIISPKILGH